MMIDGFGRRVSYLRLSVTDRCNLRCFYCVGCAEESFIPHKHILSYEEMLGLIKTAQDLGIEKVRLTGGEPFARRDFPAFLGLIKEECPGLDVRLTTNGVLLAGKAPMLKHLGVTTINISLDTLDPAKYKEITGRDYFHRVRSAVDEALRYGLRVKINVVAMKGFNDMELPDFIELAKTNPLDVRFIEFMPMGGDSLWDDRYAWSAEDILQRAGMSADLTPVKRTAVSRGPADMFLVNGGPGRLGVISPMSNHFCASCNRLRITCDGRLRTCLFSDKECELRPLIRDPRQGFAAVEAIMRDSLADKPMGHELLAARRRKQSVCSTAMTSIGG